MLEHAALLIKAIAETLVDDKSPERFAFQSEESLANQPLRPKCQTKQLTMIRCRASQPEFHALLAILRQNKCNGNLLMDLNDKIVKCTLMILADARIYFAGEITCCSKFADN
jgi:hypothetical protein